MDLHPLHHTSCNIYRFFATSRKLKRNPTILQGFVPLTCNYRSKKRQFSLLPSNLRGGQAGIVLALDPHEVCRGAGKTSKGNTGIVLTSSAA